MGFEFLEVRLLKLDVTLSLTSQAKRILQKIFVLQKALRSLPRYAEMLTGLYNFKLGLERG